MAAGPGAGVKESRRAGENATLPPGSLSSFLPFPRVGLAAASVLVAAVGAMGGPGYLPIVGPPTLRFELPPVLPTNQVILPPMAVIEARPAETNASPAVPPLIGGDSANQAPAVAFLDPLAVPPVTGPFAAGTTNVIIVTPSEPDGINPQMFMRYFTGRQVTNSAGMAIVPPVGFIPPVPIVPPSSSATFQTTPPGKP